MNQIKEPILSLPYDYLRRGDISIESTPPGVYIYIDGYQFTDNSGFPILTPAKMTGVPDGYHEIQLVLEGYYTKRIDTYIFPNKINNIFAALIPIK